MLTNWTTVLVAFVGSAVVLAQPPASKTSDPNDPLKSRALVSLEDRERLGLNDKTWKGVVHPDVSKAFDHLKIQPEDPIKRFKFNFRQRFRGTVYVQLHLKHAVVGQPASVANETAIAAVQERVLNSLTAAEFHLAQKFSDIPGMIGYATREAIAKLAVHNEVVGVCLDDKPIPERPAVLYGNRLPPTPPDLVVPPGTSSRKASLKVYQALTMRETVFIVVGLAPKTGSIPKLTEAPEKRKEQWEIRDAAVRELQDRVLSTVTAEDFQLTSRLGGSKAIAGFVSRKGLKKLLSHPEVRDVFLDELHSIPSPSIRKP